MVFHRAGGRGDGAVARGEQQPRTGRFRQEGFDVGRAPDIVHDHQRGLLPQKRAVAIDAVAFGLIGGRVVAQGTAHLLHAGGEIARDIFAHRGPGDAIREGLLHHGILA
ncbi:MAG TPA: hypothetical protein VIY49_13000 [Bryobacteraceae bacterium]